MMEIKYVFIKSWCVFNFYEVHQNEKQRNAGVVKLGTWTEKIWLVKLNPIEYETEPTFMSL